MSPHSRKRYPEGPLVYFVAINDCVKIGFSTNLKSRMKTFRTSSADTQVLLTIPGGRDLERRLHILLQEQQIERELYHLEGRVAEFLDRHLCEGFDRAIAYLEATKAAEDPAPPPPRDLSLRFKTERQAKAEKDAYFAGLVAERKERLGW